MARRYFLVKVTSRSPLSAEAFERALVDSVRRYFGEFGLARVDPRLLRLDSRESKAVVACRKDAAEDLQTALALISDASEIPVGAVTLRVSGTIKGLRKKNQK